MIKVTQVKLNIHHTQKELEDRIAVRLGVSSSQIKEYHIVKRSLDARDRNNILYSYTVRVMLSDEDEKRVMIRALKKHCTDIIPDDTVSYRVPAPGNEMLANRPVIIGFGPAGMFAGLLLARAGYHPLIFERGQRADERKITVEKFWNGGDLDVSSNVSFGEGGAGTFSDGKLNTLVKDECGRNAEVLRTLTEFGADSDILYVHNPHIGTDRLIAVVSEIRKEIIRLGGEIRFNSEVTDFIIENSRIKGIEINGSDMIPADAVVLAIGHSARNTFYRLYERNLVMQSKSFAVGLRIQHPQTMIDVSQYGPEAEFLSPASYKLTWRSSCGRGVYSFCMCPGGYVVDASSENGMKCINGMSCHDRNSGNANSALIVSVDPSDYGGDGPLAGIEYQRKLERNAFRAGNGNIPVQLLGDYIAHRDTLSFGDVAPVFRGEVSFARLDECLPGYIYGALAEAIPVFDRRIMGFSRYDAILAGIESRTSSPVRIVRNGDHVSNIEGIYPCGEGAGYAGGITSAAMDGLKTAEKIIMKYSGKSL